ncbi:MAG: terminase large subunit domain-containing protein [Planctomycetota bacterium]|jgi:hypothetical protein
MNDAGLNFKSNYAPQPKQAILHRCAANEILYGGAAGPGKSHALRQEALYWATRLDGLQVYLFRRTYPELEKNHILPSLNEFPMGYGKYRDQKRRWEFKNGSIIHMCHSQHEKDIFQYQGAEIHLLLIDELTTFTEFMYDYVRARVRCTLDVPEEWRHRLPGIICASNPGGVGHEFVKRRWVDFAKPYKYRKAIGREGGMLRCYIPGLLEDNQILMEKDPEYIHRLDALPEPFRTAYKEGDWDIFIGQMFYFSRDHHICQPRAIPENAQVYMTFDWGFGAPYSVGWWWADADGRLYRFGELYGWNTQPNQGIRQTDSQIAEAIVQREKELGLRTTEGSPARALLRIAGHDCWNKKPDYKGGGQGPSTTEIFARYGLFFSKGDADRVLKIRQFHERLRITDDGPPMVQIYNTCEHFIRTIPLLQANPNNVEDVDTNLEDHVYDEACHIFMARPLTPKVKTAKLSSYEKRLERLYQGKGDSYERYALQEQAQAINMLQPGGVDALDAEDYEDGQMISTMGE